MNLSLSKNAVLAILWLWCGLAKAQSQCDEQWEYISTISPEIKRIDTLNEFAYNFNSSSPDCALKMARTAFLLADKVHYQKGKGDAWARMTVIFKNSDQLDSALIYGEKVLALRTELGDTADIAGAMNILGTVYIRLGGYQQALALYYQALTLAIQKRDTIRIVRAHLNIGKNSTWLENYPVGRKHLLEALSLAKLILDKKLILLALTNIG